MRVFLFYKNLNHVISIERSVAMCDERKRNPLEGIVK